MKHDFKSVRNRTRGFTLIELLVVIAIIALLAGMIFPITGALNRTKLRTRAKGELAFLETAIASYKAKYGVYPPDSTRGPNTNQLYYELSGTSVQGAPPNYTFQTIDGRVRISANEATQLFGTSGFVNSTKPGGDDDAAAAVNFLKGIGMNQVAELQSPAGNSLRFLVSSVPWPEPHPYKPLPFRNGLNPWRYVSSRPVHNTQSYDLWVDFIIDGKTNRISNWSKEPLLVNTPY